MSETKRNNTLAVWKLYQQYGSHKKAAEILCRCPDTVSRHVREYEAAVAAARYVHNKR